MGATTPPMRAPSGGWLGATCVSLALLVLLAAVPGSTALDTLQLGLKHSLVALTAGRTQLPVMDGPAPPETVSNPVGVNVFLEQEADPAKRHRSLELLRAAGVGVIRQQLPWEQVEYAAKGNFDDVKFGGSNWDRFDSILEDARSLDIQVVFRIDTTPRWALPPGATDGMSPPVDERDYWDFVQVAATRYRGRVLAYQVWNEPNLDIEWGRRPPDPRSYARMLAGAAQRIRTADPQALVLMASLAPTLTEDEHAQNDLRYLQALYDAGARGSFDVLGVQAYGLRGGPDDPRVDQSDVTVSRPRLVREIMLRNGDGDRPMWATEVGWNVNPPSFQEQRFGRVTPVLQARYTVRAFERAREQWPWMQVLCVWFFKRADEAERSQDWYWFRLADPDFTLQPVYYALRDYALTRS